MKRREFLLSGAASVMLSACRVDGLWLPPTTVKYPGMAAGHRLRELLPLQGGGGEGDGVGSTLKNPHPHPNPPNRKRRWRDLPLEGEGMRVAESTDIAIIGSGVAGSAAAWTLARHGHKNFIHLLGPEPGGNAASGQWQEVRYPLGAHYLPLPSSESEHIRELLLDMGVAKRQGSALVYDESVLVHALDERLLINGEWHEGLAQADTRFFALIEQLKHLRGQDGKRVFALPLALASNDAKWRALDTLTFAQWLDQEGYVDPALRWYLDYCCRDDCGAGVQQVSAFAGLHYFACRDTHLSEAKGSTVLTWLHGLNPLIRHMQELSRAQQRQGIALRVRRDRDGVTIIYADDSSIKQLRARKVILAVPLHVAAKLLPMGSFPAIPQASWLVSNLALTQFPREKPGAELAWDNVIYGSTSLGYVVATHQGLYAARPERTVFTAYHALGLDARKWLEIASPDELRRLATVDLSAAYGRDLWQHADHLEITVRGHAMATPTPGYLQRNAQCQAMNDPQILLAHSDLSGYSVFEEASYWGVQAARACL